jgi:hypothetical protein
MSNYLIVVGSGIVGLDCAWADLQQDKKERVINNVADLPDAIAHIEQRMALDETP